MDEYQASMKAISTIEKFLDGSLDDEIKAEIRKRGLIGGICMAIPLWGIETIVYAIVLWGTYSKISQISTVPFKENAVKNIVGGFIVNLIVVFLLALVLDFIPVFGWVGSFAVGYISILLSGLGYVKMLKAMHGERAKADLNVKSGIAALKNGTTSSPSSEVSSVMSKVGFIKGDQLPVETPLVDTQEPKPSRIQEDAESFSSKAQQLMDLKSLLDAGLLTQEEFNEQKKQILNH